MESRGAPHSQQESLVWISGFSEANIQSRNGSGTLNRQISKAVYKTGTGSCKMTGTWANMAKRHTAWPAECFKIGKVYM